MSPIPVIDLASFLNGDAADKHRVAWQMEETCRDSGFFCLASHGVSDELGCAMRVTAMALFSGDPETKVRVRQPRPDTIRGFIGYGSAALGVTPGAETPPDWKETFSIGPVDVDKAILISQRPLATTILPATCGRRSPSSKRSGRPIFAK